MGQKDSLVSCPLSTGEAWQMEELGKMRLSQLVPWLLQALCASSHLIPPAALQILGLYDFPDQSALLHTRDQAFRDMWKCEVFHIKPQGYFSTLR